MMFEKTSDSIELLGLGSSVQCHSLLMTDSHIYVTDEFNHLLHVYTRSGKPTLRIDGFKYPRGLTCDDDQLFVCDSYNHQILSFTRDGQPTGSLSFDAPQLHEPSGILALGNGLLLIVEHGRSKMRVVDRQGITHGHFPIPDRYSYKAQNLLSFPQLPSPEYKSFKPHPELNHPKTAVASNDSIWVADTQGLHRLNGDGELKQHAYLESVAIYRGLACFEKNCFFIDENNYDLMVLTAEKELYAFELDLPLQGLCHGTDGRFAFLINNRIHFAEPAELLQSLEGREPVEIAKTSADIQQYSRDESAFLFIKKLLSDQNHRAQNSIAREENIDSLMEKAIEAADHLISSELTVSAPSLMKWQKHIFFPSNTSLFTGTFLSGESEEEFSEFLTCARKLKALIDIGDEDSEHLYRPLSKQFEKIMASAGGSLLGEISHYMDNASDEFSERLYKHTRLSLKHLIHQQLTTTTSVLIKTVARNNPSMKTDWKQRYPLDFQFVSQVIPLRKLEKVFQRWLEFLESYGSWHKGMIAEKDHCLSVISAFWHYAKASTAHAGEYGILLPLLAGKQFHYYYLVLQQLGLVDVQLEFKRIITQYFPEYQLDIQETPKSILLYLSGDKPYSDLQKRVNLDLNNNNLHLNDSAALLHLNDRSDKAKTLLEENAGSTITCNYLDSIDESDKNIHPQLAGFYLKSGNSEDALAAARKAHATERSFENHLILCKALFATGNTDEAENLLEEINTDFPLDSFHLHQFIDYVDYNQTKKIRELTQHIIRQHRLLEPAITNTALQILARIGHADEELHLTLELIKQEQDNPLPLFWLTVYKSQLGRVVKAFEDIELLHNTFKPFPQSLLQQRLLCLNPMLAERENQVIKLTSTVLGKDIFADFLSAIKAIRDGDLDRAEEIRSSTENADQFQTSLKAHTANHFKNALEYKKLSRFVRKEYISSYRNPVINLLMVETATLLNNSADLKQRLPLLPANVRLLPNYLNILAKARAVTGDTNGAKKTCRTLLFSAPWAAAVLSDYQELLSRHGTESEDKEFMQRIIKRYPNSLAKQLFTAFISSNTLKEQVKVLSDLDNSHIPPIRYERARLLVETQQYGAAIPLLESLISNPVYTERAHRILATALKATGDQRKLEQISKKMSQLPVG